MIIGFVIWTLVSCGFIGYGIYLMLSKREVPVGFWANEKEQPQVNDNDVKGYNRALGKLFCGYGIVLILLGLPMLAGQNKAWVIFTVLGAAWTSIALAIIYSTVILKKYQKR